MSKINKNLHVKYKGKTLHVEFKYFTCQKLKFCLS